MAPSLLQGVVHILFLLHTTFAVLAHLFMPFHVHFSIAFHHSSTTLDPMLMQQPNSSNAQAGPYLAVLLLSKLLQYRTESHWLLLRRRYKNVQTDALPALLHQMQHLPSHHPFHGGLVSYFLSAVHLGRQHKYSNRSKVKHKHMATSRLSHLRRIPNLLPPRCLRHLLLLLLVLLHQMQQTWQSQPLPLCARFVLSLCCVSPSHADGRE